MAKEAVNKKVPKKTPKKPAQAHHTSDIIRFVETNLDGSQPVASAIRHIKGVSFTYANAIMTLFGHRDKKFNELSEEEMKTLEDMITNPTKYNLPAWLFNRRNDPYSGETNHLSASTLDFTTTTDINNMKKLRSYKGVRHSFGLPVRGQRTRSSFRHGSTVGVSRDKNKGK